MFLFHFNFNQLIKNAIKSLFFSFFFFSSLTIIVMISHLYSAASKLTSWYKLKTCSKNHFTCYLHCIWFNNKRCTLLIIVLIFLSLILFVLIDQITKIHWYRKGLNRETYIFSRRTYDLRCVYTVYKQCLTEVLTIIMHWSYVALCECHTGSRLIANVCFWGRSCTCMHWMTPFIFSESSQLLINDRFNTNRLSFVQIYWEN